ncbi:hypothetical protein AeMF1_008371 [Aphanomyces euteiches]|nr:hypothetical protein AeMF1_021692 [Aphanomyces euteiches]KAH9108275.1 hypothetical protein AeMF1_016543 [Aphanomyces euteiches]KAH9118546.1 hypothetical protein AeMF1_008371 [Aphanomyces euteiches]KAH9188611.1 hypothetical protein AeNC1_009412 [Aphanomyces euteiches]
MAKRTKNNESNPWTSRLQEDILSHISAFIAAPDDFISLLEAIGPDKLQGSFRSIWELGLHMDLADLWPSLRITGGLSSGQLDILKHYVTFYSIVRVDELVKLEWLKKHMRPETELHCTIHRVPPADYYHELSNFRVTRMWITVHCSEDVELLLSSLKELMEHLTALVLHPLFNLRNLDRILYHVSQSKQLTEFECWKSAGQNHRFFITDQMVQDVVEWFRRQPVRVFRINYWEIEVDDPSLKQLLYETIYNCPTLDTFECSKCNQSGIDFTSCSPQMRSLQIRRSMDPSTFEDFVDCLPRSKVMNFKWIPTFSHYCFIDKIHSYSAGMQRLFEALPLTSIRKLEVSNSHCESALWHLWAPLLASSRLKSLTLRKNWLSNEEAILIVQAIKNNNTIEELDLSMNSFSFDVAWTLIECATDPQRPIKMKMIGVVTECILHQNIEILKEFATKRNIQICLIEKGQDCPDDNEDHDDSHDNYFLRRERIFDDNNIG